MPLFPVNDPSIGCGVRRVTAFQCKLLFEEPLILAAMRFLNPGEKLVGQLTVRGQLIRGRKVFSSGSPDEEMHCKAVALFDFARENENELPLVEDQVI